jgi:anti-sigma B factor antagonist
MSEGEFRVAVDEQPPGHTVVAVVGEIDVATAPELERALDEAGVAKRVVLDLSECGFIDSSGLRTLLGARSAAAAAGGSLVLVVSDPGILRVFEVMALHELLEIHDTLAGAVSSPER